jgi:beta-mannosidase
LTGASGQEISTGIFFFAKVKHLQLQQTNIAIKSVKSASGLPTYTLTSNTLAKNVYLWFENTEGTFSDNYVDILPGKPVTVTFTPRSSGTSVKEKMKVRSLNEVR